MIGIARRDKIDVVMGMMGGGKKKQGSEERRGEGWSGEDEV